MDDNNCALLLRFHKIIQFALSFLLICEINVSDDVTFDCDNPHLMPPRVCCDDNSSAFLLIMKTKIVFGIILINCLASVRALLVLRLNTVYFMSK